QYRSGRGLQLLGGVGVSRLAPRGTRQGCPDHATGRSYGGLTSKILVVVDERRLPVGLALRPDQVSDRVGTPTLLAGPAASVAGPSRAHGADGFQAATAPSARVGGVSDSVGRWYSGTRCSRSSITRLASWLPTSDSIWLSVRPSRA